MNVFSLFEGYADSLMSDFNNLLLTAKSHNVETISVGQIKQVLIKMGYIVSNETMQDIISRCPYDVEMVGDELILNEPANPFDADDDSAEEVSDMSDDAESDEEDSAEEVEGMALDTAEKDIGV